MNRQDIAFLQQLIQEQSEIWGRRSTTANEKTFGSGHHYMGFIPTRTLQLINSISAELGSLVKVLVDHSDVNFPRGEGSIGIMKDPNIPCLPTLAKKP